jgi:outer membrane lipoprotein carrier protein
MNPAMQTSKSGLRLMLAATFLLSLLLTPSAQADGLERLREFFSNTKSLSANFHQVVRDAQKRKVQEVDGSMRLLRPGKFRWDYSKPFVQHIVGDGKKVWLHDPELNQVTVRNMDQALGSSPAALLAGGNDLDENFLLTYQERGDGLEWVLATPKSQESGFERVAVGFKDGALYAMALHDSFGHTTLIRFYDVKVNPELPAATFTFTPPANADVVGE